MAVDPDLSLRLVEAVKVQAREEPDMYLVGREGTKIPAHRSVLSLFCPLLKSVIQTSPQHLTACILLPESSTASLASMVAIFYSGLVPAAPEDKEAIREIEQTCDLFGFQIDLREKVGSKDIAATEIVSEDISMEIVSEDINQESDGNITFMKSNQVVESDSKDKLIQQQDAEGSLLRKCELCEYTNDLPINLMKHYSVHHFNANISQLTDFYFELNFLTGTYDPCKVCNKVLGQNTLEKNTHKEVITHIGVYHMKILDVLKTNKIELPNFFKSRKTSGGSVTAKSSPLKEEFKCELCPMTPFATRTEFQDHLSGVHFWTELVGEYGNKYSKACSLCRFKFQTLQQLAKHIGTIHNKVLGLYQRKLTNTKPEKKSVTDERLTCTFKCPEVFADTNDLKKHYISSHFADQLVSKFGSYGSQCSLCFAWLNSKEELAVHIGDFHGKVSEMIQSEEGSHELNEETVLPVGGSKSMNEEMLVKKMIEKSKKLMRGRNLKIISEEKKIVNISMKK